jgi:formate hydrogenlyase subunit 4
VVLLLALPPLMLGVIGRTKAWCAGRIGPPLWQPYRDMVKLLRKDVVLGQPTSWVFRAGPVVGLASALVAGLLVPLAAAAGPITLTGDVVVFAGLLALGRFFTMAAALDTGSSFEGMGASREAAFAVFTEPALFLALALVCIPAGTASFAPAWAALPPRGAWDMTHPLYLLAAAVLFVVLLAENARIPVDDPATHLELTMVHEVMVLDHSGPDLAFVFYGSAVKFFVVAALLVHLLVPMPAGGGWAGVMLLGAGEIGVAVLVGIVESSVARLRLPRVPGFLIGAAALAAVGVAVLFARGQP